MEPGTWQRLGELVRARREQLGIPRGVPGSPSASTWRRVELADQPSLVKRSTLLQIARALEWTEDSPERILAGGDPVPVTPGSYGTSAPSAGDRAVAPVEDHPRDEDLRRRVAALEAHLIEERRHRAELEARVARLERRTELPWAFGELSRVEQDVLLEHLSAGDLDVLARQANPLGRARRIAAELLTKEPPEPRVAETG